jgi:hypothetical protein
MISPSTLETILLTLASVFTAPSFENFSSLAYGWILSGARGRISSAIRAAGELAPKHFSAYYRFVSRAVWDSDRLGLALLPHLLRYAPDGAVKAVADDTLTRKTGKRIWGANVHHDPLQWLSNAVSFGHNWVVFSILIRVPLVTRPVAVPILCRLYRSKKKRTGKNVSGKTERKSTGEATDAEYRTRPQLALEMLNVIRKEIPDNREIQFLGDSAYGGKSITKHLPENVHVTSRMCMTAALFKEPPPRKKGQRGRGRMKGDRLPSPKEMAKSKSKWKRAKADIYGKKVTVLYKHVRALWYNSAGQRLLNIVVVRDPKGKRKDDCFFSTDLTLTAVGILELYAFRWSLEVAFRDIKQELGLEQPQNRTKSAVSRTVPFICSLYAIVTIWFCEKGHRLYKKAPVAIAPWYTHKKTPSFADMLRTLRLEILRECFFSTPDHDQGRGNYHGAITPLLRLVA